MVAFTEIAIWPVTPINGGGAQKGVALTPSGAFVYLAGGFNSGTNTLSKWSTASNTEISSFLLGNNIDQCEVTPDGSTVVITDFGGAFHVYLWDTATDSLRSTVATTDQTFGLCLFPAPSVKLTVGNLFIPRKGFQSSYTQQDFYADWLAIELWANHDWSPSPPNLFIPRKQDSATLVNVMANWLAIEDWANAIGSLGGVTVPPLFIPRKESLDPIDVTASFLAVQDWANAL
jgi:hypothetical protein